MSITTADVQKIAKLARLKIKSENEQDVLLQLQGVLDWIHQLQNVDTQGICLESLINNDIHDRDDVVSQSNTVDDVLNNAPIAKYNMFAVPKMVE